MPNPDPTSSRDSVPDSNPDSNPARTPALPLSRYLTTSLYAVCVEHAFRLFRPEQFLFLRYEDLMRMEAPSLLRLLARFTGLSPPAKPTGSRMCQPNGKVRLTIPAPGTET